MNDFILASIGLLITVVGWFIQRTINSIDENLKTTRDKVWILQDKTGEQLAVLSNKVSTLIEETRSLGIAGQNIQREIQDLKISQIKNDTKPILSAIEKIELKLSKHSQLLAQFKSYLPNEDQ